MADFDSEIREFEEELPDGSIDFGDAEEQVRRLLKDVDDAVSLDEDLQGRIANRIDQEVNRGLGGPLGALAAWSGELEKQAVLAVVNFAYVSPTDVKRIAEYQGAFRAFLDLKKFIQLHLYERFGKDGVIVSGGDDYDDLGVVVAEEEES